MLWNSAKLFISTVKNMRNINQLLLISLSTWSGLQQSFLGAQFSKVENLIKYFRNFFFFEQGFVSCTLHVKYVGLVFIACGICDSLGCISFGQLVKYIDRWPCFVIGAIINYSLIVTMLLWKPSEDQMYVLFILAGSWGLADAVWQTQINALYGVLFTNNEEAAFSNHRLW